ncbi:PEP-CTERM sorting domain-containing protein [Verrucomicrobiaceae bacterium 227]
MRKFIYCCLPCLFATPAWSALIMSGEVNLSVTTNLDGIYIDLVSGALVPVDDDLSDSQVNFFFGGDGIFTSDRFLPVRDGTGNSDSVLNLAPGLPISNDLNFASAGFGASMTHIGSNPGQFEIGSEGYIGFKFDLLDDDNYTFGWMRVTLTNGSSPGVVHEWAYSDTPGELVEVGGPVIVPEPMTGMMTLVASLGALFLRRRK